MSAHDAGTGGLARQPAGRFLCDLAARVSAPGGGAAALHAAQAAEDEERRLAAIANALTAAAVERPVRAALG
ncbi:hypothetical protein [Microbispora sp. H10836]|uniref:hypothetical protein n=1 Tax=Microbispora sp. H10836 TaxID=2729106 RepID=UPI001B8C9477|nr:hypothetical protein [Microbispora sp. H10836]